MRSWNYLLFGKTHIPVVHVVPLYAGFSSNGKGCYFATETHYSAHDGYCTKNDDGERFIFQVRVVTGDVGQGKEGLKTAPDKPSGGQYDSVVDNKLKPRMYVVFDDCAAYPEYLIKFRDV